MTREELQPGTLVLVTTLDELARVCPFPELVLPMQRERGVYVQRWTGNRWGAHRWTVPIACEPVPANDRRLAQVRRAEGGK